MYHYSKGRAPAGCVATAVDQIMKYHKFPNTYNRDAMPNHSGSAATSILMRNIGNGFMNRLIS
ncbi:C10 family peptidase [Anditalea andensis]|uniref:C10 family peptidase n=1 Tax=Anditalea andensis TaxID=1048983 RepID=UPI00373FD584